MKPNNSVLAGANQLEKSKNGTLVSVRNDIDKSLTRWEYILPELREVCTHNGLDHSSLPEKHEGDYEKRLSRLDKDGTDGAGLLVVEMGNNPPKIRITNFGGEEDQEGTKVYHDIVNKPTPLSAEAVQDAYNSKTEKRAEEKRTAEKLLETRYQLGHQFCLPVLTADHPRAKKKHIANFTDRFVDKDNSVHTLFRDANGSPQCIDIAYTNGSKGSITGMSRSGASYQLNYDPKASYAAYVLTEAPDNADSINSSIGSKQPVIGCGSATNIPTVAKLLHARDPKAKFYVASDADVAGDNAFEAMPRVRCVRVRPDGTDGNDFNDMFCDGQEKRIKELFSEATSAIKEMPEIEQGHPDFPVKNDIATAKHIEIEWIVKGILPENSIGAIVGASGCGKTFISIDLAMSVATGKPYRDLNVHKGNVFYVPSEDKSGLLSRAKTWLDKNPEYAGESENFYYADNHPQLPAREDDFIESVSAVPDLKLLIIDTLNMTFDGDENSTSDMTTYIQCIKRLRRVHPNMSVMLVHHSGHKSKRARGSTVFYASLDCEIFVEMDNKFMTMTNSKPKGSIAFTPYITELQSEIDPSRVDSDGDAVRVAWVEHNPAYLPAPIDTGNEKAKGKGKNQKTVFNALKAACVSFEGSIARDDFIEILKEQELLLPHALEPLRLNPLMEWLGEQDKVFYDATSETFSMETLQVD